MKNAFRTKSQTYPRRETILILNGSWSATKTMTRSHSLTNFQHNKIIKTKTMTSCLHATIYIIQKNPHFKLEVILKRSTNKVWAYKSLLSRSIRPGKISETHFSGALHLQMPLCVATSKLNLWQRHFLDVLTKEKKLLQLCVTRASPFAKVKLNSVSL